jgi:hypothetical protein
MHNVSQSLNQWVDCDCAKSLYLLLFPGLIPGTSSSTPVFAAAPNLLNRFPDADIFPSQASTASFRRLDEPNLVGRDGPVSRN